MFLKDSSPLAKGDFATRLLTLQNEKSFGAEKWIMFCCKSVQLGSFDNLESFPFSSKKHVDTGICRNRCFSIDMLGFNRPPFSEQKQFV